MTHDVRQWLAEIKTLQQKLAEARQERDEAYASAANWRTLYETEAKQRRIEANLAQQTIDALKTELDQLQHPSVAVGEQNSTTLQQTVEQLAAGELRSRLLQVMMECDRLSQALKVEQINHAKTRQGLTTALGDTMDMLNRERSTRLPVDASLKS